ncbi:hypothetical protein CSOJ01_07357 [Colletotrichum sojae]|uniref:Uncharacterized protein n=1 Tax=Colletotrichum sojae TaxID=2175907 RepID=A0A8H6MUF7_9PEZI|nr:hypothetical protein CSOJ01_07357 [Colletotrichum sojae]
MRGSGYTHNASFEIKRGQRVAASSLQLAARTRPPHTANHCTKPDPSEADTAAGGPDCFDRPEGSTSASRTRQEAPKAQETTRLKSNYSPPSALVAARTDTCPQFTRASRLVSSRLAAVLLSSAPGTASMKRTSPGRYHGMHDVEHPETTRRGPGEAPSPTNGPSALTGPCLSMSFYHNSRPQLRAAVVLANTPQADNRSPPTSGQGAISLSVGKWEGSWLHCSSSDRCRGWRWRLCRDPNALALNTVACDRLPSAKGGPLDKDTMAVVPEGHEGMHSLKELVMMKGSIQGSSKAVDAVLPAGTQDAHDEP